MTDLPKICRILQKLWKKGQKIKYTQKSSIEQVSRVYCFHRSVQKLPRGKVFHFPRAGYWVQFSTSNNSTSLFDHWLLYRHCAKLTINRQRMGSTQIYFYFCFDDGNIITEYKYQNIELCVLCRDQWTFYSVPPPPAVLTGFPLIHLASKTPSPVTIVNLPLPPGKRFLLAGSFCHYKVSVKESIEWTIL